MRISEYHRKPNWQRFFAGIAVGAIISWLVFLVLYGTLQERQLQLIEEQNNRILDLEKKRKVLTEDINRLNEDNKNRLKIVDIKIKILNVNKFGLDSLIKHNLEKSVINDLNHLLNRDINSVSNNKELLRKAIENKVYEIDEKKYLLKIYSITFDTVLDITLKMELAR